MRMEAAVKLQCQQADCDEPALWYVHDDAYEVTLALCELHKVERLQRSAKVLGKVGDPDMSQEYKEARQYDEWYNDLEGRALILIKWLSKEFGKISIKELNTLFEKHELLEYPGDLNDLMLKAGWKQSFSAFEGEHWVLGKTTEKVFIS